jgi:hypothetical protein
MEDDSADRISLSRTASAERLGGSDDIMVSHRTYLSDMIGQMQAMALGQGLVVTAALLNLARAEVDAHIDSRTVSRRRTYRRTLKK